MMPRAKDRHAANGTASEHVEHPKNTGLGLLFECLGQRFGVDAGQRDIGTEAIDQAARRDVNQNTLLKRPRPWRMHLRFKIGCKLFGRRCHAVAPISDIALPSSLQPCLALAGFLARIGYRSTGLLDGGNRPPSKRRRSRTSPGFSRSHHYIGGARRLSDPFDGLCLPTFRLSTVTVSPCRQACRHRSPAERDPDADDH